MFTAEMLAPQKKTDTQNHSLPRVFLFHPLFKNFLCYVQRKPEESTPGPTGHRPIKLEKPDPSTVQSVERQNYQETCSISASFFKIQKQQTTFLSCLLWERRNKVIRLPRIQSRNDVNLRSGGSQAPPHVRS